MTNNTIAIDIALLPGEPMQERARAMNARLRRSYAAGFPLDDTHLPHITLVQAFVPQERIDEIWQRLAGIDFNGELEAIGFDFYAAGEKNANKPGEQKPPETGTSGFDVQLRDWLYEAQRKAVQAVARFALPDADASAYFAEDQNKISASSLNYVREFLHQHAGEHYKPHVTLGIAKTDLLTQIREEPFQPFRFAIEALAICQLGNHGTCRRILKRKAPV